MLHSVGSKMTRSAPRTPARAACRVARGVGASRVTWRCAIFWASDAPQCMAGPETLDPIAQDINEIPPYNLHAGCESPQTPPSCLPPMALSMPRLARSETAAEHRHPHSSTEVPLGSRVEIKVTDTSIGACRAPPSGPARIGRRRPSGAPLHDPWYAGWRCETSRAMRHHSDCAWLRVCSWTRANAHDSTATTN